jgi:hypothetical protein
VIRNIEFVSVELEKDLARHRVRSNGAGATVAREDS